MVVGQIMQALLSGKYDVHKVAIIMSQTGGGCRASNYIGFIRRALKKADLGFIPVISINLSGLEANPGFKITPKLATRLAYGAVFGDVLMKCLYRMRVGIVGEILVKFLPAANNYLAELLEKEGAEAVCPDLLDFMNYCFYNQNFKAEKLGFKKSTANAANLGIKALEFIRGTANKEFEKSRHFTPSAKIEDLAKMAAPIVSMGNQTGEGWFLTGEMELIHSDAPNIVCIQPFACLPNHIVGKGVIKAIRKEYPKANIVAIDYDPGASEVNQLNRIKLMLSTAFKRLDETNS